MVYCIQLSARSRSTFLIGLDLYLDSLRLNLVYIDLDLDNLDM